MPVAQFDPWAFSADAKTANTEALDKIREKLAGMSEKEEALANSGLDVSKLESELMLEKRGEEAIKEEMADAQNEVSYKASQIKFYQDGVRSVQRLYEICVDEMAVREKELAALRLDEMRKTTSMGGSEQQKQEILKQYEAVKSELAEVTTAWQAADGELQLMLEKARNQTNKYFGSIQNDYEALREYRKLRYYTDMYETLVSQLKKAGTPIRTYQANRMYAGVLRHKVPLKQWVEWTKEQLTRPGVDDTDTPMADDNDTQQVITVLSFLSERAKKSQDQTWPE